MFYYLSYSSSLLHAVTPVGKIQFLRHCNSNQAIPFFLVLSSGWLDNLQQIVLGTHTTKKENFWNSAPALYRRHFPKSSSGQDDRSAGHWRGHPLISGWPKLSTPVAAYPSNWDIQGADHQRAQDAREPAGAPPPSPSLPSLYEDDPSPAPPVFQVARANAFVSRRLKQSREAAARFSSPIYCARKPSLKASVSMIVKTNKKISMLITSSIN